MPFSFYTLPTWISSSLIVAAFVIFALLGVELIYRFHDTRLRRRHNDIVGFIIAVIGVNYAVLLGSVAIIAVENYEKAKDAITKEASNLEDIQKVSYGLPTDIGKAVRLKSAEYKDIVIRYEWATMRNGNVPHEAQNKLEELQHFIVTYQPTTLAQQNIHMQLMTELGNLNDGRQERLVCAAKSIEPIVWIVVVLGSIGMVAFSFLFGLEKRWHQVLSGSLAALVALLIILIATLDHPYWGNGTISNGILEQIFSDIER